MVVTAHQQSELPGGHTEADLVAAIEADPDDTAAYLVYADWLIERGDPRGELITLHAEDPTCAAAERHLERHRRELLGPLAVHAGHVTLDWQLGFVRAAHLIAIDEPAVMRLLDAVLESPACRFLRTLVIQLVERSALTAIDARLARAGSPRTLEQLELGTPEQYQPSDALLAAFPRLSPRTHSWDAIAARIATLSPPALALDPARLAPVTVRDGGRALPGHMLIYGLVAELQEDVPLGLVALLRATCDPGVLDRYATSLVEHALVALPFEQLPWVWDVVATLGGPQTAHALAERLATQPEPFVSSWIVQCLERMATPLARLELFASDPNAGFPRVDRSTHHDADELVRAGSDPRAELSPRLAERFAELDLEVIEGLVATAWTTTLDDALELFVRAPRRARARGLVWAHGKRKPPSLRDRLLREAYPLELRAFQLTEHGPADRDGIPLHVGATEPVWLVHPCELSDGELAAWQSWQRAQRPAYPQLDRFLPALPRKKPSLTLLRAMLEPFPAAAALRRRGFFSGAAGYGASSVLMRVYRYRGIAYSVQLDLARRKIERVGGSELPPVVIHELARDLVAAMND
ncbi:MAG TPA: TIGR02996 domain-containing protein [Kofleriaceae bacterium]|nr:TIGR02996 domain-containing protein [Kofleriaceae bacterium]